MIALLTGIAFGQEVTLGVGRIGVLDPGVVPREISTSASEVLDVVPSPPVVLLVGLKAGSSTVTIASDSGLVTYAVRVEAASTVAPSGGPGLAPAGDALELPLGVGAVCRIPQATSLTRVDDPYAQVHAFGTNRYFVQVDRAGRADVAFETGRSAPRVLTVAALIGAAKPVPTGCTIPTETITVPAGGTTEVTVGKRVAAFLVGTPTMLHVVTIDNTDRLRLSGIRAGTTTLVVRSGDDDDPWMRTVVVAPAQ
ncbi:MAG: pilus assembly protein N-terminal domain-containing protein [Myxococcota bacterium]